MLLEMLLVCFISIIEINIRVLNNSNSNDNNENDKFNRMVT